MKSQAGRLRTRSPGRVARAGAALLLLAVAAGCGGGGGSGSRSAAPTPAAPPPAAEPGVVATAPYDATAPHADNLRPCTYAGTATRQCTLATLPFLGMEHADPTIDQVLGRTLVSHRWMGDNFAGVLAALPADVLGLFRSITAVVIASDVRPAYYDPETGAIYLDPEFLWLSVAERNTVSDDPDPRSEFGRDLSFHMPWRYVRDGQRLTVFLNPDGSRDPDQIIEIMGFLLYHELAHAVDFMAPDRLPGLAPTQTAAAAILAAPPLSSGFVAAHPLSSEVLKGLASVSFLGATASSAQRALQPEDLVDDFANDGATQYYAYTTQYEDFASLFETAMMKWRFGYDKDTAIAHWPTSNSVDDSVIAWGERGRLGGQSVINRALAAGQRVYAGELADFEAFLLAEPAPLPMPAGTTWGENLVIGPAAPQAETAGSGIPRRRADPFLERVRIR